MRSSELEGKKIIVSGAANGIGSSVFHGLLQEGAFPIGIDLETFSDSELDRKISGAWKIGQHFDFFQGDASKMRMMRRILATFDRFDGLVNNAGLLGNDDAHGGRSIESFSKLMAAHAQTALVLTEITYPKMKNGGSIVNIGSIEVQMAAPNVVLYTAAKGALLGMTVAYATSLAPKIRVNMISPGNVNTVRNKAQYENSQDRELIRRFEGRTPLKRSVEPEEIADMVLFLLSRRSSAITGQDIVVDCGYTRALWDPSWISK